MNLRHFLLLLITIVYVGGYVLIDRWTFSLYYGDSNGYYLHVVSALVNQDVGDYDQTITSLRETNPNSADPREDKYGIRLTDKGRRYIKYTVGTAVMEVPFFLVAHAYAKWSDDYKADGWSKPYLFIVSLAPVFYALWGFYLLIGVLRRYFSKAITALTVLSIAFATNLFFHTTSMTMSHGFLFFDFCLLIYLTIKFYESPSRWRALAIGATIGLIALTRVPEVVGTFIPLLWGVVSWKLLRERVTYFVQHYQMLLLATLGFSVVFSLQVVYWYYVSGKLFFNPYEGESFDFTNPHILNGWFHFANGWLIYTPIMAGSLIGWFLLRKKAKDAKWAMLSFVGLQAYIHYSYYVWNYFPGLGSRPMIETYAVLSFALAAFYLFCYKHKPLAWLPIPIFLFFTWLNLFQTWQFKEGVIWSERGSKAFYVETFGTLQPSFYSLVAYDTKERQPNLTKLKYIETLHTENFEDTTKFVLTPEFKHKGQFGFGPPKDLTALVEDIPLENVQAGQWLRVRIQAFMPGTHVIYSRDRVADLHLDYYDAAGQTQKSKRIKITSHVGNEGWSIWSAGDINKWDEASFFVRVPKNIQPDWKARVTILNHSDQVFYVDDLSLEHYEKK